MAEGGTGDIPSLASFKDLGLEETETENMTTLAGVNVIIHNHYHQSLYIASNVNHGEGDIVQGSKIEVIDSQIEALTVNSGESDPTTQQHPEKLSRDITQAVLEWVDEEKIPTQGIENVDDTAAGNQTRLKQIVGNSNPATSGSAPEAKRNKTNHAATDDPNECINPKLIRQICDLLQELLTDTDNSVKKKKIYSILCDINSVTKPLDTPQVKQGWTQIEDTDIWYDQTSRYRSGSKVFNAIRKSGAKDQETVVKFVTNFNLEDKKSCNKIQREIENCWETHIHKNVVTYFQSGGCKYKEKHAIFILMEKCDRATLYERITERSEEEGNLPYIERAKTVKCIAQGLQHLKKKQILHRDLKPQNILYRGDVNVIADFGLSKKISSIKSHTIQSSEFLGTLGWGAPETYSANKKSSYAADIYSAGLIFHFALTNGKHPYGDIAISRQTYINDDKNGETCNLDALHDDTPDGIVAQDLISRMLSRDPKDRPAIEEVLMHPFFWNLATKKKFYYDICSTMEFHNEKKKGSRSRIFSSQTAKYLNEVGTEIKNWENKLLLTDADENNIKDNFEKRKMDITVQKDVIKGFSRRLPDSVTSMVIFIRNRFEHSGEDKRKGRIDLTDEQLWEFFNIRCPHLFIYTYYASKEYYEAKPAKDPDNLKIYF